MGEEIDDAPAQRSDEHHNKHQPSSITLLAAINNCISLKLTQKCACKKFEEPMIRVDVFTNMSETVADETYSGKSWVHCSVVFWKHVRFLGLLKLESTKLAGSGQNLISNLN